VAYLFFFQAYEAIDRANPAALVARTNYWLTLVVAAAACAIVFAVGRHVKPFLLVAAVGLPTGMLLAFGMQDSYGPHLLPAGDLWFALAFIAWIGTLLATILLLGNRSPRAAAVAVAGGLAIAAAMAVAALYHVMTLEQQVEMARAANKPSPWPGLAFILVLLGAAWSRRRNEVPPGRRS
jgi:MYXO-CTERM domain-containing protein